MKYDIRFKPRAIKDLKRIPRDRQVGIIEKIEEAADGLKGDVKKLTNFTPEYRLRVGTYRVLFEVESTSIVIYRVRHRRDVYR